MILNVSVSACGIYLISPTTLSNLQRSNQGSLLLNRRELFCCLRTFLTPSASHLRSRIVRVLVRKLVRELVRVLVRKLVRELVKGLVRELVRGLVKGLVRGLVKIS